MQYNEHLKAQAAMLSDLLDLQSSTMAAVRYLLLLLLLVTCPPGGVARGRDDLLNYQLTEEEPLGTIIGNIITDARLYRKYQDAELRKLRFSFLDQPDANFRGISLGEASGILRVSERIDRDTLCSQHAECHVYLNVAVGPAHYFQVITIRVVITDSNDNSPTFPHKYVTLDISEATPVGMGFALPLATDPDSGSFSVQLYEMTTHQRTFSLRQTHRGPHETDLRLVLREKLDREARDRYQLRVRAFDGGVPARWDELIINITVTDANDNQPRFDNATYKAYVNESAPIGQTVLRVHATDQDLGLHAHIIYSFSQRTRDHHGDLFAIDATTGFISLKRTLDYEQESSYHLVVNAGNTDGKHEPGTAAVVVHVLDINDNSPQISVNTLTSSGSAEVREDAAPGSFVAHISARDQDSGRRGQVVCFLRHPRFDLKHLQGVQYKVVTRRPLDRETSDHFRLPVSCHDLGEPRRATTELVHVKVVDANDHAPKFRQTNYQLRVRENNEPGRPLCAVNATDGDIGANAAVEYRVAADGWAAFSVNPLSGVVTAKRAFDFELQRHYQFHVEAVDGGAPRLTSTATITVRVVDENDEAPQFVRPTYTFHVRENAAGERTIGTVSAADADQEPYNKVVYSFPDLKGVVPPATRSAFGVNAESGRVYTLRPLDREADSLHRLTVMAANPGFPGMSATAQVEVYVSDENDNSPVIEFPSDHNDTVSIPNHIPLDYIITRVRAHDADDPTSGGNARLGYAITRGNEEGFFRLDPTTGALSVDAHLTSVESATFNFRIRVSDGGRPVRTSWCGLTVVVNKSLTVDFIGHPRGPGRASRAVMVALAAGTAALLFLILAAITVVKSCDRKDKVGLDPQDAGSYVVLAEKDATHGGCGGGLGPPDGSNGAAQVGSLKKGVTFSIDMTNLPSYPQGRLTYKLELESMAPGEGPSSSPPSGGGYTNEKRSPLVEGFIPTKGSPRRTLMVDA